MTTLPFYWVDAFTDRVFSGNPAGVCPVETWPSDEQLQRIAWQNGLAETAFHRRIADDRFELRWFTPGTEIDLCGHATLAPAHVLYRELGYDAPAVFFETRSGTLVVRPRGSERMELDFPARPATAVTQSETLSVLTKALGTPAPDWVGKARDYLIVVPTAEEVRTLRPDLGALTAGGIESLIVSAPGEANNCDFVSRFFAPGFGVPEDPVTGSAHCTLVPYWAGRLGRTDLHARQLSARGGELWCQLKGERVRIAGRAATYLVGEIRF